MPGIPSALASLGVGHSGMAAAAAAASRLGLSGLAPTAGHNVLLVSNLNPQVSFLVVPNQAEEVLKMLKFQFHLFSYMNLDQIDAECFAPVSHHLYVTILVRLLLPPFIITRGCQSQKNPSLPGPLCV